MNTENQTEESKLDIERGTILRTSLLALALINQVLVTTGHSVLPITDATLTSIVTTGFTLVMASISWWKNNSFTQKAIAADKTMKDGE